MYVHVQYILYKQYNVCVCIHSLGISESSPSPPSSLTPLNALMNSANAPSASISSA